MCIIDGDLLEQCYRLRHIFIEPSDLHTLHASDLVSVIFDSYTEQARRCTNTLNVVLKWTYAVLQSTRFMSYALYEVGT